jgi:hypothetical protein
MSDVGSRVSVYNLHPFEGMHDNTASGSTALFVDGNDIRMAMDSNKSRRYVHQAHLFAQCAHLIFHKIP